jgi:cytochrome c551/c552
VYRMYMTFAVLSTIAAVLFGLSLWKDSSREWKRYQKTFIEMERQRSKARGGASTFRDSGYRIHQIIVGNETRIDRCTTCHLGVEDPRFAEAEHPFRLHPSIPKHPFEKFGCTLCHRGQGLATTAADAHGDVPFWEEPILKGSYLESSCGSCHLGDVKGAPLLARGRALFSEAGCVACHKVRGFGGSLGPDLTQMGDHHRDPEWHLQHFRDPQSTSPESMMPPFDHLLEEDLVALTVYMLSLKDVPSRFIFAPLASKPEEKM